MSSGILYLKQKYGLAHVPSAVKSRKWVEETERLIREGSPDEQAGMEAAMRIFGYEYKESSVYEGQGVDALIAGLSIHK